MVNKMTKKEVKISDIYKRMVSDITLSEGKEIGVEEYFPDLPDSIIELIEADHNKKEELVRWVNSEIMGTQFNAIRLCCIPDVNDGKPDKFNDDLCESYKICPLFMNKAAPVGKLCPLEKFKVNRITQELINELDIDIFEDYTDKYIIGELVTYSLIEDRAARALASSSLGLTTITLGKNGKEYKKTKSFFLDVISEMGKRKADSRKSLIATRDEKQRIKNEKGVGQNKDKFDELVSLIENRNNKKNNGLLFSEAELIDDEEGENNG